MKVSIITIAFNSESMIEETIKSVLVQDYPQLEYWIIDGASKDGTVKIAQSYEAAFAERGIQYHIVSETDEGIYDAMNKGIRLATGDVIGLINSGDRYEPEAIKLAVKTLQERNAEIVFGNIYIRSNGRLCVEKKARQRKRYQTSRDWNHPSMFVKSELYKQYPFRNQGIHDDYAFYLQMRKQKRRIEVINRPMASFWLGGASNKKSLKTAKRRIHDRYYYCYRENGYSRWYLLECIMIEAAKWFLS